ncbi:GPI ethanolamine phosphate transferase 2 [Sabethes cyaneus]|uniref:GPI ethanolamine phosphate transferase 2 n=1 Tax=Sabethes cyaneus TaxID=53552 RepID=UPI00237E8606|nr:GPI ethanolamine phosphate transferase 2 [Sabethes cyaneus]
MITSIKYIWVYLYISFFLSMLLFSYGFFPLSYTSTNKSSLFELPNSLDNTRLNTGSYKSKYSRIILMVVDAMRSDFVVEEKMPFLSRSIASGVACQYRLQVHPPTVTMPRIKAITSGSIPSFLDVIFNLGSSKSNLDTFLYQMVQQHQRIVFYGDDTWTNMFPETFYRQGENVDSLFVNDFYNGDKNITKSMRSELYNNDWELMILHYLGLDHIGHVEGPYSEKVPPKLKEMDNVVVEIVESMKIRDKTNTTPSLLLITADHGMRDSGGHGGSTIPETNVPLLVFGNNCSRSDDLFMQIDMAPTLAAILGVAIPHSSIGSLIEPLLSDFSSIDKAYVSYYNTKRLIEKVQLFSDDNVREHDFFLQYKEAKLLHTIFLERGEDPTIVSKAIKKYAAVSRNLSALLIKSYIKYDEFSMLIGICLGVLTSALSFMLIFLPQYVYEVDIRFKVVPGVIIFTSLYCFKYVIYELMAIQQNSNAYHLVFVHLLLFVHWSIFRSIASVIKKDSVPVHKTTLCVVCLMLGFLFHMISSCSSSFIEEEHQIWYYFCNTLFVLMILVEIRKINQIIEKVKLSGKENKTFLKNFWRERQEFCIKSILFLCSHIVLRRWNQTGDKWQHVTDIGDWLSREERKGWLSVVFLVGLSHTVFAIGQLAGVLTTVLSAVACLIIYYYRLMTGFVCAFGIIPAKTNSYLSIFWINLLVIFAISFLPKIYYKIIGKTKKQSSTMITSAIAVSALLSMLVHKPHNVVMVAALLFSSRYLIARIDNIAENKSENLLLKIGSHIWLGRLFYFYQGNSNNLATIDLNAGYVGLSSFSFYRVGFFLFFNTYHGQILSFIMLLYYLDNIHQHKFTNRIAQIEQSNKVITNWLLKLFNLANTTPLVFYVIVVAIMRNHIFVWTVFSPKLIYDCVYMTLTMIQLLTVIYFF